MFRNLEIDTTRRIYNLWCIEMHTRYTKRSNENIIQTVETILQWDRRLLLSGLRKKSETEREIGFAIAQSEYDKCAVKYLQFTM